MEHAALVDAAVVLHGMGEAGPAREASRSLLNRMGTSRSYRFYASAEMVQEVVFHRLRRTGDRARAAREGQYVASIIHILNFDREILDTSLDLIEHVPTIRGRDAVHAATALAYGIDTIISPDSAFDGIPGLRRVDAADYLRELPVTA